MTPNEFEKLLILSRANLTAAFQHGDVTDLDTHTKAIIDYQEAVSKHLFQQLHDLEEQIAKTKGDILKDNRERFDLIMKAIKDGK